MSRYSEDPVTKRYPEWFVGGPWHGKDKLKQCPNLPGPIMVSAMPDIDYRSMISADPHADMPVLTQVMYVSQQFIMIDRVIPVWIPAADAVEVNVSGSETYKRITGQIVDLIMAPHENRPDRPAFDTEAGTDAWRHDWEIRRQTDLETRQSVRLQYEQRLQELSLECQRLRGQIIDRPSMRDDSRYCNQAGPGMDAGQVELVADGKWDMARFDTITTYLDQGDDEQGPSWVATAQGDRGPVTGYGTSRAAAILAMLADSMNIYARMIDTSENPRIK